MVREIITMLKKPRDAEVNRNDCNAEIAVIWAIEEDPSGQVVILNIQKPPSGKEQSFSSDGKMPKLECTTSMSNDWRSSAFCSSAGLPEFMSKLLA